MGMHGQCHASAALPPGKKPFAHSTGEEKIPSSSGVQTPNRQPVVFRYTE